MRKDGLFEYTRECKMEGALLVRSVLLFALYLVFAFVTVLLTLLIRHISPLLIFGAITVSVIFITKPFFSEKRDYEIAEGTFTIYKVYGNTVSKKALCVDITKMTEISPYSRGTSFRSSKVKDLRSRSDAPDAYYFRYKDRGEDTVVIFDADEKFFTVAAFYNPRAFKR